ncbi:MAG: hypothetical protein ACM3JD_13085 [Rudaea sp.]
MSTNIPEPVEKTPTSPTEPRAGETTLTEEFHELGRQLTTLLRIVRESPKAREIETQVRQVMRDVERQVDDAMTTTRQRVQEQNLKDTFKGAAQTAADETQRGLAKGLRVVNEQMARLVQEAEKGRAPATKAQVIEVEAPPTPAAAGETPAPPPAPEPPAAEPGEKKWYDSNS